MAPLPVFKGMQYTRESYTCQKEWFRPLIPDECKIDNFVDGVSIKKIGMIPFELCKDYLDDLIIVPEGKICQTILELYNKDGIVSEPAWALDGVGAR